MAPSLSSCFLLHASYYTILSSCSLVVAALAFTFTTTAALSLLSCALLPYLTYSQTVSISSITPNFTASFLQFIDNSGAFLVSKNGFFQASIMYSGPEAQSYYFVIMHVPSNTIVWSANRNTPISTTSLLRFSPDGLTLYNDTGHLIWSTPVRNRPSAVSSLQLLESGNLIMVDRMNSSVWESFDFPTDVIVMGQNLRVGKSLVSSVSEEDLSEGSYRFVIDETDAVLQWNGMTYWKLSLDTKAFRETNFRVEYMVMNFTAMYLMGLNGTAVVIRVVLHSNASLEDSPTFPILKLGHNGIFNITNLNAKDRSQTREFTRPDDHCRIPFVCKKLSVCSNGRMCQCVPGFQTDLSMDCVPADTSLVLPGPCNGSIASNGPSISYLSLKDYLDYFSNDFMDPVLRDVNLSVCQDHCSRNCSCLGIFYSQNSRSCYAIRNYIGSIMIKTSPARDVDRLGYIKTTVVGNAYVYSKNKKSEFPVLAMILFPSAGVVLISVATCMIWFQRIKRRRSVKDVDRKFRGRNLLSSAEDADDRFAIPGFPSRFDYEELVVATEKFRTQIGSGGFGIVFKGTLGDGTDVAVKKITCLGDQGKTEFLTEIGVIGKIHHANLVSLKGFCAQGGQRFLAYEYMNLGSLDRILFGTDGPVLEWEERYDIALGSARGLAYLHTGCEHKIIHCDVKPENILLCHNLRVKISDFGLSKLLSREQSGFFTTLRGTRGYVAPEWLTTTAITDRADVYSYGMVLLEILRGKRNSIFHLPRNMSLGTNINGGHGQSSLTDDGFYFPHFALEMHERRKYLELVDPRLTGRVTSEEVKKLVTVALCCLHKEPNLRPSMSNVVRMLEGEMPLDVPRISSLNFLRFYSLRSPRDMSIVEHNEPPQYMLHNQSIAASSPDSCSFSYITSQQVSGPR